MSASERGLAFFIISLIIAAAMGYLAGSYGNRPKHCVSAVVSGVMATDCHGSYPNLPPT